MKRIYFTFLILIMSVVTFAQPTQTIRGRVIDKITKTTLPGATVVLLNSSPLVGTVTSSDGTFRLPDVAVGRQSITVSFVGYKTVSIQNLIVIAAKEVVVEVELEENVIQSEVVEIKGYSLKDETINRMASVSARSFSVEETEKYAGSRGDVARMAMNFAGVSAANDQRNDIIIRGNSPSGLLWRLDDIEIPNPNHFAENGTTGGPVSMLNNNVLSNSDFMTGAFPAEYGNALSGVFDLNMRNGNNENHEFMFMVGYNGFEAGAEGPFNKNKKSSYLANFRYSTMELMDNFMDIGTTGIPKYWDLSYKMNFPVKKGNFAVFGLVGRSAIEMLDSKDGNEQDLYSDEGQDLYNSSDLYTSGVSFTRFINTNTYYKLIFSGMMQNGATRIDTLDDLAVSHSKWDNSYSEFRLSASGFVHTRFSSHLSTRIGFKADRTGFDMVLQEWNKEDDDFRPWVDNNKGLNEGMGLYQAYGQATYRFNDRLSLVPGLHLTFSDLNASYSVEPRLGMNLQIDGRQKVSFGYGLHSRMQDLATLYIGTWNNDGTLTETNTNLDFTKSHQLVAGYERYLSENTRFKSEAYYQYLYDVPVEKRSSSFSMLNTGASWGVGAQDSLVNKGTGRNYGLEFTLERFFSRNIYYLTTLSLFQSKYKGSDNIERNTAFNNQYVLNMLVGKEFTLNPKSSVMIDFKLTFAGGKYYTPVDLEASEIAGETKYDESKAYSQQFNPFFKADIKFGYRRNGKRISQEYIFYVENFTDHENVLMQVYSPSKNKVNQINQLGVFPMLQYKINF